MPRKRDALGAAHASRSSSWKARQRLGRQLARTPQEDYDVLGETHTEWCGHGVNIVEHPEHNCREYENAKRAERGAPPL